MLLRFSDWLVYSLLGLDSVSLQGQILHFFLYDSLKIILLLYGMIFIIGVARTFISQNKVKIWLHKTGGMANFFAAMFGAITPFCSCSSIPIFISFLKTGVPLGVTFSFLITSPLINEYLFVLMLGFFGWKITLAYVISGLSIGIVAGILLGRMGLERYIESDIAAGNDAPQEIKCNTFKERILFGINEAHTIVKKLWIWVLVGVGIGAGIHNFVPEATVQGVVSKAGVFSVPIAVLLGVPMYGSCAAIVPIAVVLFQKGFPLGTALSFMMAVAALSLPEAIMLRRAMKLKLIAIFFAITTCGIIFTGYLFNILQNILK